MYVESAIMLDKLANKIYNESDLFAAFGIGLATGYLIGLTICVAILN